MRSGPSSSVQSALLPNHEVGSDGKLVHSKYENVAVF